MTTEQGPEGESGALTVPEVLAGIAAKLIPSSIKAIDRLVGAGVDIPAAWLAQKRAQIDARTESLRLLEQKIANAAASKAGVDPVIVDNAISMLVAKQYKRYSNRLEVAKSTVDELKKQHKDVGSDDVVDPVDDDWMNIFERYAEDASSERMQILWGRVLAGEIRTPGKFSPRTLRFLAEFSKSDAIEFENVCKHVMSDAAPKAALIPHEYADISRLIQLEFSGLLTGVSGLGLEQTFAFSEDGKKFIREGSVVAMLSAPSKFTMRRPMIILSQVGRELVDLIPGRDKLSAARNYCLGIRVPEVSSAILGVFGPDNETVYWKEKIWGD